MFYYLRKYLKTKRLLVLRFDIEEQKFVFGFEYYGAGVMRSRDGKEWPN